MKSHNKSITREEVIRVFQENETFLRRFLRRFTSSRHDIDDICQETITRALEAVKSREIESPKAFLFGISKNIVRKNLDRESKKIIDFIEDLAPREYLSMEPSVEDTIDSRERLIIFTEALALLPNQCQKVFIMKKVYGYSHKEIATALHISLSTVEKHVATGLKRCSEYMTNPRTTKVPATDVAGLHVQQLLDAAPKDQ